MTNPRSVRIGCASAFWGDSQTASSQLVRQGALDYLVFDYLAEITMSIMAGQRMRDPDAGYARDFVETAMAPLLSEIAEQGLRVIANAGGINPLACRDALQRACEQAGVDLKIAVVLGDDLSARQDELRELDVREMDRGEPLPPFVLSANAYLGAQPIVQALAEGADVVITGRVTDSAMVLAPLVHEFGWAWDDFDRLAAGSLAGHLIECGTQATGGNFTDWRAVPGFENMGFPIVEVEAGGEFVLTKPEATGGLVTQATVAEQLVYEIGDPQDYILPDVRCDFSRVRLQADGANRVRVSGATGRAPPHTLKVAATWPDGFRCVALFMLGGLEAPAKARRVAAAILEKSDALIRAQGFCGFTETSVEVLGAESTYGPHARRDDSREVMVKVGVRHPEKRALVLFSREIAQAATAMAPGITGYVGGRPVVHPLIRLFSFLLAAERVECRVRIGDEETPVPLLNTAAAQLPPDRLEPPPAEGNATSQLPLMALAHARSGDKGNHANIGVIARRPEYLPWIAASLTSNAVAEYFDHVLEKGADAEVRRWYLPGIDALNFLLLDSLGGGGMASLRMDPQGKAFAQMLLDAPIRVPADLAEKLATGGPQREPKP
ncbi:MAG: acyclic terpene utilization AtuA family protein [Wenzhouxiangellaceae bacterium]|nr:acyclic terpene utilization AtuA family protein [Wenzhouxiangellaceae bacterium]